MSGVHWLTASMRRVIGGHVFDKKLPNRLFKYFWLDEIVHSVFDLGIN